MNKISNISIQNIKGFGTSNNSFDIDLVSNKFNILVAPNGFGKSSIATAFSYLAKNKLNLPKELYHKGDDSQNISLTIKENGQSYLADIYRNEISTRFKVFCIKNRLYAKAVSKNMGRYSSTTGHLAIDTIIITTPDGEIKNVWDSIKKLSITGKIICHCSGSLSSKVFSDIDNHKAYGYSIHPMFAISDKYNSYKNLNKAFITIEGSEKYLLNIKENRD